MSVTKVLLQFQREFLSWETSPYWQQSPGKLDSVLVLRAQDLLFCLQRAEILVCSRAHFCLKCVEVCFVCHAHIYFACNTQLFSLQRSNLFYLQFPNFFCLQCTNLFYLQSEFFLCSSFSFHPSAKIYFENRLVCDMFLFYLVSSILYAINILFTALSLKLNALISTSLFIF